MRPLMRPRGKEVDLTDIAVAHLPDDAARKSFKMRRHNGRDQVATALADGGWESFEQPFPAYFYGWAKLCPGLIVDVGANTGFYTLLAACASPMNRVISVEPNSEIMAVCQDNVLLSGMTAQVMAAPLALSDKPGRATLFIPTQEHGLIETSSSLEAGFKAAHSEMREVEVDTLDGYVNRHRPGEAISIIKVDVEGHEPSVLKGARDTIAAWRPVLFVEVLWPGVAEFSTTFLKDHDYSDLPLKLDGPLASGTEVEFVSDGWNHAFVPNEKLALFMTLSP